ncbi:MAG: RluA family pseudouridine synthase [Acholeplasmatales bacterium]|nr:RluA family pseudouridine synthase [Acholeplasmatales bacterium]
MEIKIISNNDTKLILELHNQFSRHLIHRFRFGEAKYYVNGIEKKSFEEVKKGDEIKIIYDTKIKELEWPLYESSPEILYENNNYLVVNKPSGLLTLPTKGNQKSIYQECLYHLKKNNEELNLSVLNRLDKDTSGLLLMAKNKYAASLLSPVKEHIERRYYALVDGIIEKDGIVDAPIIKVDDLYKRKIDFNNPLAKEAKTKYHLIKNNDNKSLIELKLYTGRTHQIRLHMSYLGHGLIGDDLYGIKDDKPLRLTSYYIKFYDSFEKKEVEIKIDPFFINEI